MILRQLSIFIATYFLREKFSRPQNNWISDSAKALTYSAVTNMFINKLSVLLKKSVVVIPLVVLGTVLGVFCYLDLMNVVDYGVKKFAPSFLINLVVTILSFLGAIYVLKTPKDSEVSNAETGSTEDGADPLQTAGLQIQENFAFFKRGFAQAFEKPSDDLKALGNSNPKSHD